MKEQFDLVLKELVVRHREFFETKMAFTLMQDLPSAQVIIKISNILIDLFKQFSEEIVKICAESLKLSSDLYNSELYGHLTRIPEVSHYQQMLGALIKAETKPTEALHVQMCFIHRIYDHLELAKNQLEVKQKWVKKIFTQQLFSDRARKEVFSAEKGFYKRGICRLDFFNKKIVFASTNKPAKEKFRVDPDSTYYKEAADLVMPTVCGPSGHTGSLILLAGLLNVFNQNEWQDYALVIASFLVIAGAHSFHESLMVAKTAGVRYEYGNYHSLFSQRTNTEQVAEILEQDQHLLMQMGGN